MDSTCVVLLADLPYLEKALITIVSLRDKGQYKGPLCLVIGNDLQNHPVLEQPIFKQLQIQIAYFPNFPLSAEILKVMENLERPPHWFPKRFQFHKFHLFSTYFKQWRRIFYLDAGIKVLNAIQPLLDCWRPNKVLAHSDAYPQYQWTLRKQFVPLSPYIDSLEAKYDLDINYPQSTILLYDSNILEENTVSELYSLLLEFPNIVTNDQAIFALYLTNIRKIWQQIPTGDEGMNFYDYLDRHNGKHYIMLKLIF